MLNTIWIIVYFELALDARLAIWQSILHMFPFYHYLRQKLLLKGYSNSNGIRNLDGSEQFVNYNQEKSIFVYQFDISLKAVVNLQSFFDDRFEFLQVRLDLHRQNFSTQKHKSNGTQKVLPFEAPLEAINDFLQKIRIK
jgi:hypothetical protein